jgi:hypothetical protein
MPHWRYWIGLERSEWYATKREAEAAIDQHQTRRRQSRRPNTTREQFRLESKE